MHTGQQRQEHGEGDGDVEHCCREMSGRDRGSGVRNRRPDGHQGDRRNRRGRLRRALEAVRLIAAANSDRRSEASLPGRRLHLKWNAPSPRTEAGGSVMFEELIWHGEDIVRRLDAERALNPAERASYPDYERVPIGEAEVWRKEVERRIGDVAGAYALSRYEATRQQLRREIDQQTDTELDRWSRWYQRVLSLLRGLQRQYGGEPAPSVAADAPSVVQQLASDAKPAEYDVALSFAGEDRPLAGKLAGLLHARHIRVFYDEYEKASLWGKDLYQ